ncbi:hypothetical protein AWB76_00903 [Caballeronia temeraria]|uniref:Uncharacterized protein n=1 Tax=Caballeronia temeraria TaxID=1777137 RepID=A0A157ZLN6_9BURK|nr:hypothetical protein [Caballeronia temeraria]SAK46391.1 hypothetical protein AWB76_00903 [Caballeronia temeraria]
MQIDFYTDRYFFSHAKSPRGFGCWVFEAHIAGDKMQYSTGPVSYAVAKKAATNWVREQVAAKQSQQGVVRIIVMP